MNQNQSEYISNENMFVFFACIMARPQQHRLCQINDRMVNYYSLTKDMTSLSRQTNVTLLKIGM